MTDDLQTMLPCGRFSLYKHIRNHIPLTMLPIPRKWSRNAQVIYQYVSIFRFRLGRVEGGESIENDSHVLKKLYRSFKLRD